MMPSVGTMSSRAGKEASTPTVIFQSNPAGSNTGPMPLPSLARYEFSECAAVILFSSAAVRFVSRSSGRLFSNSSFSFGVSFLVFSNSACA